MITSTANQKVKQIVQWQTKAKARKQDGVFLAEGHKMFAEAPLSWIAEVYVSEEKSKQKDSVWDKLQQSGYEVVSKEVFAKMSDTQTPQGILTVLKRPEYALDELLDQPNGLYVLLENLQDPGNLGTILRTAEAAGVTGVIMTQQTVDLFNPKTIRSTMGSIYRVPFVHTPSLGTVIRQMRERNIHIYASHLQGSQDYHAVSYRTACAFLVGNEGNGLSKEIADLAESYIKIPMEGQVESLNAAVATALMIYEARRQRT